jgi:hypothetical protein
MFLKTEMFISIVHYPFALTGYAQLPTERCKKLPWVLNEKVRVIEHPEQNNFSTLIVIHSMLISTDTLGCQAITKPGIVDNVPSYEHKLLVKKKHNELPTE